MHLKVFVKLKKTLQSQLATKNRFFAYYLHYSSKIDERIRSRISAKNYWSGWPKNFGTLDLSIMLSDPQNNEKKCCGTGMFIPNPNFYHPRFRIRIKEVGIPIRVTMSQNPQHKWNYTTAPDLLRSCCVAASRSEPNCAKAATSLYWASSSFMLPATCFMDLVWAADPTRDTDRPTLIAGRIPVVHNINK